MISDSPILHALPLGTGVCLVPVPRLISGTQVAAEFRATWVTTLRSDISRKCIPTRQRSLHHPLQNVKYTDIQEPRLVP
ncbi:MAG: hypothetical protein V1689_03405 [Pseudomonadota bacterium]